jgi:two-component system, sensor histidine kinase and response regulator
VRADPTSPTENILVVDDQAENRQLVESYLRGAGYNVVLAENGEEAVAQCEKDAVALVLLDVLMPGIDGFETSRRIRALKSAADTPIIFLTALSDSVTQDKARAIGAADFIGKPINETELLMRVKSLLWMRRLTDDLKQGHELIRSQHDAVIRAQERKEELINLVVHDLKNPIASILANAHFLVREPNLSDDARDASRDIHEAADSMQRMVLNLLDISRSEQGALVPRLSDVDVPLLITEVLGVMSRRANERQQKISAELSPQVKRHVVDRDLLLRLLENLLDNALKYSPPGGTIKVEASTENGYLDLCIRDEGPGIPGAYRERIFEKYVQLEDNTVSLARTSRGLGLVFCRLAAEAHGGRIWVEDNEPRGTAFRVRLRAAG